MYVITDFKETLTPPSKHITFMQIATPGQCEIDSLEIGLECPVKCARSL